MKNLIIALIVILVCGTCGIVSFAAGSASSSETVVTPVVTQTKAPEQTPTPTKKKTALEAEYRTAFLDGCIGTDKSMVRPCTCSINALEEKLGAERIIEGIFEYGETGELPNDFQMAVLECF